MRYWYQGYSIGYKSISLLLATTRKGHFDLSIHERDCNNWWIETSPEVIGVNAVE